MLVSLSYFFQNKALSKVVLRESEKNKRTTPLNFGAKIFIEKEF